MDFDVPARRTRKPVHWQDTLSMRVKNSADVASGPPANPMFSTERTRVVKKSNTKRQDLETRRRAPLATPTDLKKAATKDIAGAMNAILADVFALYMKTKNFHWHMSGPHFRDYHLLLDEQADQIYAMADPIAERVRKIGGNTLRSIGQISKQQRVLDNDAEYVTPADMLAELADDNLQLVSRLREAQ